MSGLKLGVIARTHKENEHRLPIHPEHLDRIDKSVIGQIYLERGYGEHFGISDKKLSRTVAGLRSREELIAECDVILLAKPDADDLAELRDGQILWGGWPHCVQDAELTQQAIDRHLTLIAFEAMNLWRKDGSFKLHVFHKNNEMAGYCSVLHALEIIGSTGTYGRRLRAAVIGFGATARGGAVTALNAIGVHDIDILTNRNVSEVASPIHSAEIVQFESDEEGSSFALTDDGRVRLAQYLAEHDVVVNCVLQDPMRRWSSCTRPTSRPSGPGASSSTYPATPEWVSAGRCRRRSTIRRSSSATTSPITRSTTARPTCGTPPPGKSVRH